MHLSIVVKNLSATVKRAPLGIRRCTLVPVFAWIKLSSKFSMGFFCYDAELLVSCFFICVSYVLLFAKVFLGHIGQSSRWESSFCRFCRHIGQYQLLLNFSSCDALKRVSLTHCVWNQFLQSLHCINFSTSSIAIGWLRNERILLAWSMWNRRVRFTLHQLLTLVSNL